MKFQRVAIVLTVLNLLVLVFVVSQDHSSAQPGVAEVLRARAFEIVDENGKVRAQINIEKTGEAVFRLRDQKGTIRTKIGAGEDGSGLSLMDDRTDATVQIKANKDGGGITLFSHDGQRREVK